MEVRRCVRQLNREYLDPVQAQQQRSVPPRQREAAGSPPRRVGIAILEPGQLVSVHGHAAMDCADRAHDVRTALREYGVGQVDEQPNGSCGTHPTRRVLGPWGHCRGRGGCALDCDEHGRPLGLRPRSSAPIRLRCRQHRLRVWLAHNSELCLDRCREPGVDGRRQHWTERRRCNGCGGLGSTWNWR